MNRTPSTNMQTVLHYYAIPTGAEVGTALDTQQYDNGHAVFIMMVGNLQATPASAATLISITECETSGGTYTAITGADFTDITTANDGAIQVASLRLQPRMRYLKFAVTGGGANDAEISVIAQLIGASESSKNADAYVFEV